MFHYYTLFWHDGCIMFLLVEYAPWNHNISCHLMTLSTTTLKRYITISLKWYITISLLNRNRDTIPHL